MQKNTRTLTARELDITTAVCEAVAAQFNVDMIVAEKAQAAAQKAYTAHAHPGESRYDEETVRLHGEVDRATDALGTLAYAQMDEAAQQGFKVGQVHGFRLGLQMAARSLQGTPSEMMRLLEAAGDNAAAARLIAELVGAAPVEL